MAEVLEDRCLLSAATGGDFLDNADFSNTDLTANLLTEQNDSAVISLDQTAKEESQDQAVSSNSLSGEYVLSNLLSGNLTVSGTNGACYVGTYCDAEKTGSDDSELCWAAAASNILYYTGWANSSQKFYSEDDVFAYFNEYFTNAGGVNKYGLEWFFTGTYRASSPTISKTGGGGFYSSDVFDENCTCLELCRVSSDKIAWKKPEGITTLMSALQEGKGCNITLGWYNSSGTRTGGHTITIWGYTYDSTYSSDDFNYITGVIVSDSDDDKPRGEAAPDLLKTLSVTWNEAQQYYTVQYGNSSVGVLESFTTLSKSPYFETTENYSTIVTTCEDIIDPNDGKISLREAIANAGKNGCSTTVTFDSSLDGQTITLSGSEIKLVDSVTIDASRLTKGITLSAGENASTEVLKIKLDTGESATLKNITIQDGNSDYGGGIYLYSGDLILESVQVKNNTAKYGGGIYVSSGTLTITGGAISNNTTSSAGGGIYVKSNCSAELTNVEIKGNTALQGGGIQSYGTLTLNSVHILENKLSGGKDKNYWMGGGLYIADGTAAGKNLTISNNTAYAGAGIYCAGNFTLDGGTISHNTASSCGGGISISGTNDVQFTDLTISENSAAIGAGILFQQGNLTLTGVSLLDNIAQTEGGGIRQEDGTLILSSCTVSGNQAGTGYVGGGLSVTQGTAQISQTDFTNNSASTGGGIYSNYGILTLDGGTISHNTASSCGGGIYLSNNGSINLTNVNVAEENTAVQGGGIYSCGILTVSGGTISDNNAANSGGGIYLYSGAVTITSVTMSGNEAQYGGGAYLGAGSVLNLTCSAIEKNKAVQGGGIHSSGTLTMESVLIAENTLSGSTAIGGGFLISAGVVNGINITVTKNSAQYAGGIAVYDGTMNLYNSIVLLNTAAVYYADIYKNSNTAAINGYYTLSSFTDWTESAELVTYDEKLPLFADWENGDYSILADSQAVNKGNNEYVTTTVDLAGKNRFYNVVDLGAYENQGGTPLTGIKIDGTALRVGQTIKAITAPDDANVAYQWYRWIDLSDETTRQIIEGATDQSYLITDAEKGCYLEVTAAGKGDTTGFQSYKTTTIVEKLLEIYFVKKSETVQEGCSFYTEIGSNASEELASYVWTIFNSEKEQIAQETTEEAGYLWNISKLNLTAGSYTIQVTATAKDGSQCTISTEFTVMAPEPAVCVQMTSFDEGHILKLNLNVLGNLNVTTWTIQWEADVQGDVYVCTSSRLQTAHYYQGTDDARKVNITLTLNDTYHFALAQWTIPAESQNLLPNNSGVISEELSDSTGSPKEELLPVIDYLAADTIPEWPETASCLENTPAAEENISNNPLSELLFDPAMTGDVWTLDFINDETAESFREFRDIQPLDIRLDDLLSADL